MAKRTKSSRRWLAEHESDAYVKRAREEGYRSRAVFKLEDIQRTERLVKPGMTIVDLGAALGLRSPRDRVGESVMALGLADVVVSIGTRLFTYSAGILNPAFPLPA